MDNNLVCYRYFINVISCSTHQLEKLIVVIIHSAYKVDTVLHAFITQQNLTHPHSLKSLLAVFCESAIEAKSITSKIINKIQDIL